MKIATVIDRKANANGVAIALISRGNAFWLVEQIGGKWSNITTELSETVARRIYNGIA